MKRTVVGCLLGLLAVASVAFAQAQQSSDATEKAVAALEYKWLDSQKANDPEQLRALLADKFVGTTVDGKAVNKEQFIAAEKQRKYASVTYEGVHVTVFGDTAIATGTYKGKGTGEGGKAFDEHGRWTDTWVKMAGGKWQCVADHNSPIP